MNFKTGIRGQGSGVRIVVHNLCVLCVLCGLILISCTPKKLAVQELTIERDGQVIAAVKAEIAKTDEERAKGLMYRKKLPDGEGMLFVYEYDHVMSFWMKNTYIPLSIAYISSDGRIVDIKDMHPHDTSSVMSSRSVRYAMEVPQGWFGRAGILEGDRIRIEDLKIGR